MEPLPIDPGLLVSAPVIIVSANEAWNLVHFRRNIIRALIDDGFKIVASAPFDADMSARLEELGCAFDPVPIDPAGINPLRDAQTMLAYQRIFARHRPIAFLSWTIKPNLYGAIAARMMGTISFPNVSGLGTAFMRQNLLNLVVRQLYRHGLSASKTVFFQNHDDCSMFVSKGLVRTEQARILPGSGVDTGHFAPSGRRRRPRGRFLMLARLIADKGVREFVEAARSMKRENPDLRFTIMGQANVANRTAIGAGELQDWLDEGVIEYCPPAEDVRPAIEQCDFIVLPSYREGMSRVLLEAAAMGRPIITCDVSGCRDIVTDGVNGYLCRARDAQSLHQAFSRAAATSDEAWLAMGQAGRRRIEDDFSETMVIDAYRAALTGSGIALPRIS
ncbi:MAG: glycosyltransferase family 1 protein [Citromicrobium sp.]|nr:MAG: glycosyltransferase family 1 protein [Citromicrobium sp.]